MNIFGVLTVRNFVLGGAIFLVSSLALGDELLPKMQVGTLSGKETTAEIYLSSTVYTPGQYIPVDKISLPRNIKISTKIKPEERHIGRAGRLLFLIKYDDTWHMIDRLGNIEIYEGREILYYDSRNLDGEISLTLLDIDLTESFNGAYEIFTGYEVDGEIIYNISPSAMELITPWSVDRRTTWLGSELESRNPLCSNSSIRWNGPVIDFDINLDGINDFFIPIGCYQAEEDPVSLHNVKVQSSWKMFCSIENDHYDCTEELFGMEFIDNTLTDTGGGGPYTHVMDEPRDLNSDGFPDFWYAMNRDDGRVGAREADLELLESLCSDKEAFEIWGGIGGIDCTRNSLHTIFLSRSDGTYEIIPITPWGRIRSHNLHVFENNFGGFDFVAWGGDGMRAARLIDREFQDVTEEFKNYKNGLWINGTPYYNRVILHENKTYFLTPEVSNKIFANPETEEFGPYDGNVKRGFSLWEFRAGDGFYLSDYYTPKDEDVFTVNFKEGDVQSEQTAFNIKGGVMIKPNWFFHRFIKLSPDEEPTLIVWHESDAGTTFGNYFKEPVNEDAVYSYWDVNNPPAVIDDERSPYWVTNQLNPVEGFYIRDGKLIVRESSVVEGDYVFGLVRMDFSDLNNDGFIDMLGESGGNPRGTVFLNNGKGTLEKLDTSTIWPFELTSGGNQPSRYGGRFVQLDPGDTKLDFIYWNYGYTYKFKFIEEAYKAGDIGMLRGILSVDDIYSQTIISLQNNIERCFRRKVFWGQCYIY